MRALSFVLALSLFTWMVSCTHAPSGFHTPDSRYGPGALAQLVFVDGKVYLNRFGSRQNLIGPFEQEPNGGFSFEDPPGYFHSVSAGLEDDWIYCWSYLHMSGDPVDASELDWANRYQAE